MPEHSDDSRAPRTNGHGPSDANDDASDDRDGSPDLPDEAVDEAERLTRLARDAVDPEAAAAYRDRRDDLADRHGYTARIREDDPGETLVLHPAEWVEDGTVRPERIEDTDRAAEVSLSGPGDPEEWAAVDEHNRDLVAAVRDEHGDAHGDNAAALADFAGNHYAKEIESLTAAELSEFVSEYYRRNVWPSPDQRSAIEESIRIVFEAAGVDVPRFDA